MCVLIKHRNLTQLVEYLAYTEAVIGSTPVVPTICFAGEAQLVEPPYPRQVKATVYCSTVAFLRLLFCAA